MNRNRFVVSAGLLVSMGLLPFTMCGCGPRLDSGEFGTILHEIPKVPGADKPYPMPQLDEPKSAADESSAAEHPPAEAKALAPEKSAPAQDTQAKPDENQSDSTIEPQE